jgi:hypothetical protein
VDLSPLLGARLVQVCFGENEVGLRFDPEILITIESPLCIVGAAGDLNLDDEAVVATCHLLGASLSGAHEQDDALWLGWDTGAHLVLASDSEQFENFRIEGQGTTLTV